MEQRDAIGERSEDRTDPYPGLLRDEHEAWMLHAGPTGTRPISGSSAEAGCIISRQLGAASRDVPDGIRLLPFPLSLYMC